MELTVKQASLVFAVIGLVVLLFAASTPVRNYIQLKYFLTFAMIFIMTYWMTGYIKHSLYYSAVITLVVLLVLPSLCSGRVYEHFEAKGDPEGSAEGKTKAKAKAKAKPVETFDDEPDEEPPQYTTKETFDTNDHKLLNIGINGDSDDELENARGIKSYNDPYIAQKETYRLIDTVKQLKDATTSLAPILKEGQGIMEAFKKLNLKM